MVNLKKIEKMNKEISKQILSEMDKETLELEKKSFHKALNESFKK